MVKFTVLLILVTSVRVNNSANVLCMFTSPAKTQIYTFMAVARTLIERDHNVTIVTTIPIPFEAMSRKPFRHVFLKSPPESIRFLNQNMFELSEEFASKFTIIKCVFLTVSMFTRVQKNALESKQFQEFLNEDNHFDLMILGYFHNDFTVGVAARYRCSIAVVSLAAPFGSINRMIGNPAETTYVQMPFFGTSQPMSFMERAKNFLWSGVVPLVQLYADYQMESIYSVYRFGHASNVLCMFTSPLKPNLKVFMAVANTLIERNHNLTIVTTIPIPPEYAPKKNTFRHILLNIPSEQMMTLIRLNIDSATTSKVDTWFAFVEAIETIVAIQRDALTQQTFKEFFREDNKFDLMVLGYLLNDFMVGVAPRYSCPIAVVSFSGPFGSVGEWVGNPPAISYVMIPFLGKNQPMSFVERLQNAILHILDPFIEAWANYQMENIYSTLNRLIGNPPAVSYVQIAFTGNNHPMNFVDRLRNFALNAVDPLVQIYTDFMMDSIYRSLFPDESYPSYSDVISNISLVLYNRHFSEMPIRPLVPALVEIGGIQDEDQSELLPQDIKEFLDAADQGAIFFRVGSIARSTELKPDQIAIILNELSNLNQRTVWEWEHTEKLPPTNYSNIMFRPFIVPNTILPHPNIKLYITDGRPLGIHEATYHGVPMLGLPLFGEELYTVEEMRNRDFGTSLDVSTMTEKSFNETLRKVLNSPFYSEKVKRFSQLFRDRPNTARETAAFWLEYVIRHRGALHMQSPLVHMNFVKRWNIDVIVVLLVAAWVFVKLALFTGLLVRVIVDQVVRRRRMRYKMKFH